MERTFLVPRVDCISAEFCIPFLNFYFFQSRLFSLLNFCCITNVFGKEDDPLLLLKIRNINTLTVVTERDREREREGHIDKYEWTTDRSTQKTKVQIGEEVQRQRLLKHKQAKTMFIHYIEVHRFTSF